MQTYEDFDFFLAINRERIYGQDKILSHSTIYYIFNNQIKYNTKGQYKGYKVVIIIPKSVGYKGGDIIYLETQRPVILKEINKKSIKETILAPHYEESKEFPALCAFSNTRRSFLRGFNENNPKEPVQLRELLDALGRIIFKGE